MALTIPTNDLTGNTIASTYDQILFIDGAALTNSALFAVACQDGETALHVANDQILIKDSSGTDIASCFEVQDKDGTVCLSVNGTNNRVGIGIASPSAILDISKDASGGQVSYTRFTQSTDAPHWSEIRNQFNGSNDESNRMGFWIGTATNDTPVEVMTLRGDGSVGIGTATPEAALHVSAADDVAIIIDADSASNKDATLQFHIQDSLKWLIGVDDDSDKFCIGQTATLANSDVVILASGNVGIGTATPDHILHVEVSSGEQEVRVTSDSLADTENSKILMEGKKSGGSSRYAGAGVVYNDAVAQAAGYLRCDAHDGVAAYIYLDEDDDLQVSNVATHVGTTSGQELHDDITASDERLKEISPDAFPYGLSTINSLSPIKFRYKYKIKNDWKLGLGAQTTQPIVPETVIDTDLNVEGLAEGETKLRMSYSQFIPILIKAVQELSAKVTALENA